MTRSDSLDYVSNDLFASNSLRSTMQYLSLLYPHGVPRAHASGEEATNTEGKDASPFVLWLVETTSLSSPEVLELYKAVVVKGLLLSAEDVVLSSPEEIPTRLLEGKPLQNKVAFELLLHSLEDEALTSLVAAICVLYPPFAKIRCVRVTPLHEIIEDQSKKKILWREIQPIARWRT
jgi:hypothetical protein